MTKTKQTGKILLAVVVFIGGMTALIWYLTKQQTAANTTKAPTLSLSPYITLWDYMCSFDAETVFTMSEKQHADVTHERCQELCTNRSECTHILYVKDDVAVHGVVIPKNLCTLGSSCGTHQAPTAGIISQQKRVQ